MKEEGIKDVKEDTGFTQPGKYIKRELIRKGGFCTVALGGGGGYDIVMGYIVAVASLKRWSVSHLASRSTIHNICCKYLKYKTTSSHYFNLLI